MCNLPSSHTISLMSLENRTILVVGGAAGIGKATAELCAQRGAHVIVADFNESEGNKTAAAFGGDFYKVNVTDEASVKAVFDAIAQKQGKLDAIVQTAGILKGAFVSIEDFSPAMFREVLEVNTIGSFLCAKYATPLLKKGNKPAIILISSGAAHAGSSSYAYGTSKGGVSSLGITLANKLDPEGVRVNTVHPGNIDTAMKRSVIEQDIAMRGAQAPQAQLTLGEPMGVAKLLAFLVSEDADYVRGFLHTR